MTKTIALAGNPNVGKSTIFNELTGSKQHVGNWPGKTVEKKEGRLQIGEEVVLVVDLPGTYSLTAYSIEEIIARDFIVNENPTAVVAVVDASNLERNLYFVAQLIELDRPVIIALNMTDIAKNRGLTISPEFLSERMGGIPVVETVGNRALGLDPLKEVISRVINQPHIGKIQTNFSEIIKKEIVQLRKLAETQDQVVDQFHPEWLATKLLENDPGVLAVPVTFPPEDLAHGEMLGGLPLPDVRGTLGTFYYWASDLSAYEEGNTEFGGFLKRLLFDAGVSETVLKGPENPILKQEEAALREKRKAGTLPDKDEARLDELGTGKDINLPMTVRWSEGSDQAAIEIQGQKLSLRTGEWSDWVPLTFKVNALVRVHGMTQFHVIEADRELRLYASPVNLDPRNPPIPISTPAGFSKKLAGQIGIYRTLGWAESADKPLNEGRLDEAEFLYDSDRAFDDREKIILKNLERDDWDLFVCAIETTDRIQHMMWRLIDPRHPMYDAALAAKYGDAIEKVYRRADDFIGRVRQRLPKDVVLMVMSDHGFHSFRREVNLNTWLVQNGYMVVHGQSSEKGLQDLFGRGRFFEGVDWSRTKAYAVGLGQIYFNLKGREAKGIVSAGEEYRVLQDEIRDKLLPLTDPDTGERIFSDIYKRDDIYKGEYIQMAPDLQVGFLDGYRVGWQDTLGTIRRAVVENNNKKWSGDHCATASEISHGIFFSNRKITTTEPDILDLGPTVLKLLEAKVPSDYDGKPLW